MKTLILASLMIFTTQAHAAADDLECTLDASRYGDFPPHLKVESDLNGDGINDTFYLAGEEEEFKTCVFLGEKTKDGIIKQVLVHSNDDVYNPILDLDGSGVPQLLVAEDIDDECEPDSLEFVPAKLKPEMREFYNKAAKKFEKYNFTYNMPEHFPIINLFALQDVKIYKFKGDKKVETTKEAKPYLALKKKVLEEALKNRALPAGCKKALQKTLKSI